MKEGGSIGTMGMSRGGMRASPGIAASRSFGPSLSGEARMGAKAPSMFNKSVIGPRPTPSIVNLSRGREAPKGMFKDIPSVGPKPFGVKVDIQHARTKNFPFARTPSLIPDRPIIDRTRLRPVEQKPASLSFSKETPRSHTVREKIRTQTPKPTETLIRAKMQPEARIRQPRIQKELVLWERPKGIPSSTPERKKQEYKGEKKKTTETVILPKRRIRQIGESMPAKRRKVSDLITISPELSPHEVQLLRKDLRDVKHLVHTIIRTRKVTYKDAQMEAARMIAGKYKEKVKVKTHVQEEVKQAVAALPKTDQAVALQTNQHMSEAKTKQKMLVPTKTSEKGEKEELHFTVDALANSKRVSRVVEVFQKVSRWKKNEAVTGWDIAHEMGEVPQNTEVSELTRPHGYDYRFQEFVKSLGKLGEITDIGYLISTVQRQVKDYTAVKLSKMKKEDAGLIAQDAVEVYGRPLKHVDAYVADKGTNGVLNAYSEVDRVKVIRLGDREVYSGVTDEQGVQEMMQEAA